ncbi:MAG: hypothetical protein H0T76_15945 [Nannocystis sp.]|nr:hypothetical protein [Nannocystis sp.]MBA3547976.1 hypothetical protein [Nannocystis sp.]
MKSATAPEVLDKLLTRWRAALPVRYAPAYVDGFLRRHRALIEALVAGTWTRRRAERGDRPQTAAEFAAYDAIVARERPRDADSDKAILARLMTRIDADLREGYRELMVFNNLGLEYIDTRTEAILLRSVGWDTVPLPLPSPALAVLAADRVIALRDSMGGLAIHPDRRGTLNHLRADLRQAEETIVALRKVLQIEPDTKERLTTYARAMWRRARAAKLHPSTPNN